MENTEVTLLDYYARGAMVTVLNETQETVPASLWDWLKHIGHNYGLSFLKVKYRHIDGVYEQAAEKAFEYAALMVKEREKYITQ